MNQKTFCQFFFLFWIAFEVLKLRKKTAWFYSPIIKSTTHHKLANANMVFKILFSFENSLLHDLRLLLLTLSKTIWTYIITQHRLTKITSRTLFFMQTKMWEKPRLWLPTKLIYLFILFSLKRQWTFRTTKL